MAIFKNDPRFRSFRTHLRKNLTPAEAKLWKILKGAKLGDVSFTVSMGWEICP